jgi:hypothetical protein
MDERQAMYVVGSLLEDLLNFYGQAGDADQVEQIAILLVYEYGNQLTTTEVALMLKDAKVGKYGKVYGKLDGAQVMQWAREFVAARTELVVNRHRDMTAQVGGGVRERSVKRLKDIVRGVP